MKKWMIRVVFIVGGTFISFNSFSQEQEMEQLVLDIEKLTQLKSILSDMKKGYQIVSGGYNTIKDLSKGNFNLHKSYLDGLWSISPVVSSYKRIADIVADQLMLVKEYKQAYSRFRDHGSFNVSELGYISRVYSNLVRESLNNMDALTNVITANKLRMSDDERLRAIDHIYNDMQEKLAFLRHFNDNASILSLQREKETNDVNTIQNFYDLNK